MRPRAYALALGGGAALLFLTVAATNLLIDPQGVFNTAVLPIVETNTRYTRFLDYQTSADSYDGLLFGSSRAGAIPREDLSRRTGVKFANFAVEYGLITDHLPVLEYVIKEKTAKHLSLKTVFLLLDLDFFGDRPHTNESLRFLLPPEVNGERYARFWWRNLTGIQYQAWSLAISNAWRIRHSDNPSATMEILTRYVAAAGSTQAAAAEIAEPPKPQEGDRPTAIIRIPDRLDFQNQYRLLERFVALCRAHNVSLIVATSPLSREWALDFDPEDLRQVADIVSGVVPLWDFTDPKGLSDDPAAWVDRWHFREPVGRLMLDRIFGAEMPAGWQDFGRRRPRALPGL